MAHRRSITRQAEIAAMDRRAVRPVVAGAMVPDLAHARMAVPAAVRLGPDRLEWIPGSDTDPEPERWWSDGEAASTALWAFLKLATEPDEQRFAAFAQRYGVLALTEDGLPAVSQAVLGLAGPGQLPEPWQGYAVWWEPISAWRVYAAEARAIVHLAMALRQGGRVNARRVIEQAGLESDLTLNQFAAPTWGNETTRRKYVARLRSRQPAVLAYNLDRPDHTLASQRQWLAAWVSESWVAHAGLVPRITWDTERPQLQLPIGGSPAESQAHFWPPNMLFRVLAAHLGAFVCSGEPVAVCSRCGALHARSRKPRADQPAYCDECKWEAEKARKRAWKARQKS